LGVRYPGQIQRLNDCSRADISAVCCRTNRRSAYPDIRLGFGMALKGELFTECHRRRESGMPDRARWGFAADKSEQWD